MSQYFVEMDAYNKFSTFIDTLAFCTGPNVLTGIGTHPYTYEPRLDQPGVFRKEFFVDGKIGGQASVSYGEITLVNNDGGLDYLRNYAVDGREVRVYIIHDSAPGVLSMLQTTVAQQLVFEQDRVSIRLRDATSVLETVIRSTLYLGNNVAPNGLEGNADIKDFPKPRVYGKVSNVTPILVNSSRLIYQVNDRAIYAVYVRDKGAALLGGADYTSQADMEANAPAAGYCRAWRAGGYFRLGSSPAGLITCDVVEQDPTVGVNCTAYQVANDLANDIGVTGYDIGNLYTIPGIIGLWVTESMTYAEAFDQVLSTIATSWIMRGDGRLFVTTLRDAYSTGTWISGHTLDAARIYRIEQVDQTINGTPSPPWKVSVSYDINYTPQDQSSLASSVSLLTKAYYAQPKRISTHSVASVKTSRLLAQEIAYDSLFVYESDANNEASERYSMFNSKTSIFVVTISIDEYLYVIGTYTWATEFLELGQILTVVYPRYNLSAGRDLKIIGVQFDYKAGEVELTLWGPDA